MTNPFAEALAHVHSCDICSNAARHMCAEGEKLLEQASTNTAEAMAPMPQTPGRA